MRNKGRIIALLVVAAVLVAVWIFLGKQASTESTDTTPEPEDTINEITMVPFSQSDIVKIEMETPEGVLVMNQISSTVEQRTQAEDGTIQTASVEVNIWESKDMDIDTDNAKSVAFGGGFLKTKRKIVDNANSEDLKNFGFDNVWKVTFTTKDNQTATVIVGGETPDKNNFYVMTPGNPAIYTAGKYSVEPLKMDRLKLTNKNVYRRTDTLPTDITAITFNRDGKLLFKAVTNQDGFWDMIEPLAVQADGTSFNAMQIAFAGVTATEHILVNDTDLATYGLENPKYEFIYTLAGKEHTLQIGSKAPNSGYLYCKLDNIETVFTQDPQLFTFLDKPFVELIDKFVYIPAIYDVTEMTAAIDGRVDKMVFDVPKPDNTKEEDPPETFILNGVKLEGKDSISGIKRYYQGAIGVRADRVDFEAKPVYEPEKSVLTIEYTMRKGEDTYMKVELIPTEDGYGYYAMRNGVYSYLIVSKTQIDEESMGIRNSYKEMNEKIAADNAKATDSK